MSLLDALLEPVEAKPQSKTPRCKLGRIIEELEEPYKSALLGLIGNPDINQAALSLKLHAAGKPVSQSVVYAHRRGVCACGRVVVE